MRTDKRLIAILFVLIVCTNVLGAQVQPSASTADALTADPANCSAGQAAAGINASGVAEGCAAYLVARSYGGLSIVDNAVETAIATQNVFVQVTVFNTNDPTSGSSITADHTNDHFTVSATGDYLLGCDMTLSSAGGGGARAAEVEARKNNGVTQLGPAFVGRVFPGASDEGSTGLGGIVTLTAADTVEIWVANTTGAEDFLFRHIQCSLLRLDA